MCCSPPRGATSSFNPESVEFAWRSEDSGVDERARAAFHRAALGDSPAAALVNAEDVAAAWAELDVRSRKTAVDTLMRVTILPAGKGQRFEPQQVQIEWKGC